MFLAPHFVASDPYLLKIGTPGTYMAPMGYSRTATGRAATVSDIAAQASGATFVFVGESHNNPSHHQAQADVIRALATNGRAVTVGFEMFTRDNQANINGWTLGWWDDTTFQLKSDWKKQWGFNYILYKPVFDVIKELGLPMVALNLPRDWVRQIGRTGPTAIKEEWKAWLPSLDLGNTSHKEVFSSLMGDHPMTGAENIYAAQVSWDTGMAQSAIDAMAGRKNPKAVMVVLAGIGHTMYGQGINFRIKQKTPATMVNVACIDSESPRDVSRGIGDFVFMAPPGKE
ncbi:MAG: ChaN family lipoprotein [Chthonomonadaceae bacterium]|nr:ChaN family lipoprotein [Chthonomonadaceae bacterium]